MLSSGSSSSSSSSSSSPSSSSSAAAALGPPRARPRWTRAEDGEILRALSSSSSAAAPGGAASAAADSPAVAALAARLAEPHARSPAEIAERWRAVLSQGMRKGPWSAAEDEVVVAQRVVGVVRWSDIAMAVRGRTGKQCRERWINHLDPALATSAWAEAEDALLDSLVGALGTRWKEISASLPGRSENSVKNRYHSSRAKSTVAPGSASAAAAAMVASTAMQGANVGPGADDGGGAGASTEAGAGAGAGAGADAGAGAGVGVGADTDADAGAAAGTGVGASMVPFAFDFVCISPGLPAAESAETEEGAATGEFALPIPKRARGSSPVGGASHSTPALAFTDEGSVGVGVGIFDGSGGGGGGGGGGGIDALDFEPRFEHLDLAMLRPRPRYAQLGEMSPSRSGAGALLALSTASAAALSPRAADEPHAVAHTVGVSPHLQPSSPRAIARPAAACSLVAALPAAARTAPSRPSGASPSTR